MEGRSWNIMGHFIYPTRITTIVTGRLIVFYKLVSSSFIIVVDNIESRPRSSSSSSTTASNSFQHSMNHGRETSSLKYLGFFPAALASVCWYLSTIYEVAKDQAGPLRPGVEDVEDLLKTVLRPVMKIAEDQSSKLLDYADKKVDEKLRFVDEHVPAFIKSLAFHSQRIILGGKPISLLDMKSLELEGSTSSHMVRMDHCSYESFRKLVAVLHVGAVLRMLGPGAMYSAELYNHFAGSLREAQVPLSSYIPDVPVQVLEKALKVSCDDSCRPWQLYECEGVC